MVARLDELGVRHLREGVYANPARSGATGTSATTGRSSSPPRTGSASPSASTRPGAAPARSTRSWASSAGACATPPRRSRRPTSWTSTSAAGAGRCARLLRARAAPQGQGAARRALAADPRPVVRHARTARAGSADQRGGSTSATSTPTRAGCPRPRARQGRARARRAITGRRKPVWATEAGFHNALRAPRGRAAAGVRARRRRLHAADVPRALPRRHPPHLRLRAARREARPAPARPRAALRPAAPRLQPQAGLQRAAQPARRRRPRRRRRQRCGRCGSRSRGAPATSAGSCSRRRDGTYVVALWRLSSVWDIERSGARCTWRRERVTVRLPGRAPRDAWPTRCGRRGRAQDCVCAAAASACSWARSPLLLHVIPRRLRAA